MKKIVYSSFGLLLAATFFAQDPANSYTNGSTNTVPGTNNQRTDIYPGTHPAGDPNQKDGNTIVIPDPTGQRTGSNNIYNPPKSNTTGTVNTSPSRPAATSPTNQVNRLFQDPAKTSKYPNSDPGKSSNGSSGKYKSSHKKSNGHSVASKRKPVKKARKDNSEQSRNRHNR